MEGQKKVIALGFFDGIHLGHQALLRRTVARGREHGMTPAVFTFDRSPREVVTGEHVPLLTTPEDRRRIIQTLFPDIREVIVAPFDREMMTMPWDVFLEKLRDDFNAGWLVAGHNYRFGYQNQGDADLLRERAPALGMGCDIIPEVKLDGITVSSTHIRALLEIGDVAAASWFLGHNLL